MASASTDKHVCPSEIGRRTLLAEAVTLVLATAGGLALLIFVATRLFG
jgi:hypothetical protein